MLRKVLQIVGMVSAFAISTSATAVPITYTFTTGQQILSDGSAVGLLGATDTVSGSFVYNPEGSQVGSGIFGTPDGITYASIDELYGNVAGRLFYDQHAGSEVSNEHPPSGQDIYTIVSSPFGGDWSSFTVGSVRLIGLRVLWLENAGAGRPDFLTSNDLLPTLPNFGALLQLNFGIDDNSRTGSVTFTNFQARATQVPEPGALALFGLGIFLLVAQSRRRSSCRP